jgi:23S rRNA (cytidine1920-2'-O)/16S rRNA (cytidine1409-2'-O)-methyltransferase
LKKLRLDHLVVRRGLAESGTKAQALILAGQIRAPGLRTPKPGLLVAEDQPLELLEPLRYVSRGGEKLAGALKDLGVDPRGKVCLDVGASTGGFTDCLLQNGAERVMAVDVGHGQLHWKLRQDRRVVNREKTRVLDLTPQDAEDLAPRLAVVDVSFISLEKVLPHLGRLLKPGVEVLAMIKPQFEAGPKNAPKGVVKDPKVRAEEAEPCTL